MPVNNLNDANVLVGFETGDDAAVYRLSDELALVQTLDFFPPIVDDPFDYGAIAAANALSDVYAMGGRPISALNVAAFPRDLPLKIFASVLAGGMEKATEAGCSIVGGHTVDDREPKYGLAVTGLVEPGKHVSNAAAQAGDCLVLTKAIGTGVITTAHKNDMADPDSLAEAVKSMKTLNRGASEAMTSAGANAATDVTGFGLLGHLHSMMKASGTAARVSRSAIPVLPGVLDLLEKDVAPGGTHRNIESLEGHLAMGQRTPPNGPSVVVRPPDIGRHAHQHRRRRSATFSLGNLVEKQQTLHAAVVGEVTDGEPGSITITP